MKGKIPPHSSASVAQEVQQTINIKKIEVPRTKNQDAATEDSTKIEKENSKSDEKDVEEEEED